MKDILQIAICDDDKIIARQIREELEGVLSKHENLKYVIDTFYGGNSLLTSNKNYKILLLDVEMPGLDGFEVAEALNKRARKPLIMFLTSHQDAMHRGFHVRAHRYLVKPIDVARFSEAIDSSIKLSVSFERITLKDVKGKTMLFSLEDIVYVQAFASGCHLYTHETHFFDKTPLQYWNEKLPTDTFNLCHRSFLINLNCVVKYSKKIIELDGGVEIPLAHRKRDLFDEIYHDFIRTRGAK